jgi:hypothetical protein
MPSPKNVTVTMTILNYDEIYALPDQTVLSDDDANKWLSMEDDNGGHKENSNQSSFETKLNPGSQVTWKQKQATAGGNNPNENIAITDITYEQGSGNNVLGPVTAIGNSGNVQAQVLSTAMPPPPGVSDNEAYRITFTLFNNINGIKSGIQTYYFDPKIRIDPTTDPTI